MITKTMVKTYLKKTDTDDDAIIQILIDSAIQNFETMTGADASSNDPIILSMVVEDYNRWGSEGINALSFGAGTESVNQQYSDGLRTLIRRCKRVRVV